VKAMLETGIRQAIIVCHVKASSLCILVDEQLFCECHAVKLCYLFALTNSNDLPYIVLPHTRDRVEMK
jgi:hypothetical protein